MNPTLRFKDGWQQQIAEHRRYLLEKLIAEYPEVLKTKRSIIESWRIQLKDRDSLN